MDKTKKVNQSVIQNEPIMHLDDANLFEIVPNFLNGGVFSKALNKDGVVVRVVLLPTYIGGQKTRVRVCYIGGECCT